MRSQLCRQEETQRPRDPCFRSSSECIILSPRVYRCYVPSLNAEDINAPHRPQLLLLAPSLLNSRLGIMIMLHEHLAHVVFSSHRCLLVRGCDVGKDLGCGTCVGREEGRVERAEDEGRGCGLRVRDDLAKLGCDEFAESVEIEIRVL